jgi:hypothetical protein
MFGFENVFLPEFLVLLTSAWCCDKQRDLDGKARLVLDPSGSIFVITSSGKQIISLSPLRIGQADHPTRTKSSVPPEGGSWPNGWIYRLLKAQTTRSKNSGRLREKSSSGLV